MKIIAIVGPTGAGKSELAVKVAKRFGGEIICADSRQIYRGLDIGTGKVLGKWTPSPLPLPRLRGRVPRAQSRGRERDRSYPFYEYRGIRHHLLDFLHPKKTFSAFDFARKATAAAREISRRGRVPIVCGGTGFWIDAFLKPRLLAPVPPHPALRRKLEKKPIRRLFEQLKKLDPERAKYFDSKNKRRLIRAIEIVIFQKRQKRATTFRSGRTEEDARRRTLSPSPPPQAGEGAPSAVEGAGEGEKFDALHLGLTLPNSELKKRNRKRFLNWLKRGLLGETKKLMWAVRPKRLREIGLHYQVVADYIAGKTTKPEMVERSVNSIYHYAKRQKTWFRKQPVVWLVSNQQAIREVKKFLN